MRGTPRAELLRRLSIEEERRHELTEKRDAAHTLVQEAASLLEPGHLAGPRLRAALRLLDATRAPAGDDAQGALALDMLIAVECLTCSARSCIRVVTRRPLERARNAAGGPCAHHFGHEVELCGRPTAFGRCKAKLHDCPVHDDPSIQLQH